MRNQAISQGQYEKAAAGWFRGCNSALLQWLIQDDQYFWGENIVNRGGLPQTRPGRHLQLSVPGTNLQGFTIFTADKDDATAGYYVVVAVDGRIYYVKFNDDGTLSQPVNWLYQRLQNIQFDPNAEFVYFCQAKSSVSASQLGTLSITPTYNILMMQDGISNAASWDGTTDLELIEDDPDLQTPKGTWMAFAGNRLWVARGSTLIACDLLDPQSARERLDGATANTDYKLDGQITGMGTSLDINRQTDLVVWTSQNTTAFLSSILDRTKWIATANFQSVLYPTIGCIAGRSIVNHAGLLWWYSSRGLVNSDSAAAYYLTSKISYRDIEMARSKRNFATDLSGICSVSFDNYLLVSVPSGDVLNAHTMVLDYAPSDMLNQVIDPPAWQGVWTGTRPNQWATETVFNQLRCFQASVDYQSLGDTFIHIWEEFQDDRTDSYYFLDPSNALHLVRNQIYCEFETKGLGDSMDVKTFKYAEVDFVELAGVTNLNISVASNWGGYTKLTSKQIVAVIDPAIGQNNDLHNLFTKIGQARPQGRRVATPELPPSKSTDFSVETAYTPKIGKYHSLLLQWCGRAAIESLRFFTDPQNEPSQGRANTDEWDYNVLTYDGTSFQFKNPDHILNVNAAGDIGPLNNQQTLSQALFVSPTSPRYREVFYSSIPVNWLDPKDCVVCLPCARDTFSPPLGAEIIINGQVVT